MTTPVRVVLVDDQALLRAGIGTILSAHPAIEVVGEASTGAQALDVVRATRPDVVCMDVQMPDMDGLEATRRIVADEALTAAVVVLTTFNRDDYLVEALHAGAVGYLLKTSRPEQLTEAVLSAAAGEGLLSPEVTRAVIARAVSERAPTRPAAQPVVPLTEREQEVLALVARGLNNDEIAADLVVSRATVKTHVSNLLAKLGLRDRVQAVVYAHEHGLTG
ncbi:response regulator transcription factor [Cellulomonas sp. zg-ZUI222]|uniref:Response regulator transcription factor n=1 Tax=Cellulomonas wangleii TaxID=2816956 RepID=A0ABX8D6T9_9CELL|nr:MULTISPECIES: response regulator transcription factor [Cellulomonas]MBO0901105.1 response regulator transcription factor [Cellulomonas sp. zg-ZUI22]MBO0922582.1 response regulator transcription factor [Cellulomonas wangleii]MBO0926712.1 response regulator transcription factor [Cellulomonas wangleii]QVI63171.1 response regulator transcription factor [Cellulomonas wangleii]